MVKRSRIFRRYDIIVDVIHILFNSEIRGVRVHCFGDVKVSPSPLRNYREHIRIYILLNFSLSRARLPLQISLRLITLNNLHMQHRIIWVVIVTEQIILRTKFWTIKLPWKPQLFESSLNKQFIITFSKLDLLNFR